MSKDENEVTCLALEFILRHADIPDAGKVRLQLAWNLGRVDEVADYLREEIASRRAQDEPAEPAEEEPSIRVVATRVTGEPDSLRVYDQEAFAKMKDGGKVICRLEPTNVDGEDDVGEDGRAKENEDAESDNDNADKRNSTPRLVKVELTMTSTTCASALVKVPAEATDEQIEEAATEIGWALGGDAWEWGDDEIEARSVCPVEQGEPDVTLHFDGDELTRDVTTE